MRSVTCYGVVCKHFELIHVDESFLASKELNEVCPLESSAIDHKSFIYCTVNRFIGHPSCVSSFYHWHVARISITNEWNGIQITILIVNKD